MAFIKLSINPKHIFRSKKSRSVSKSKSEPPSLGSSSSSSASSSSSDHDNIAFKMRLSGSNPAINSWFPGDANLSSQIHFELLQAFKLMDRDGDGKITRNELKSVLSRVGGPAPPSEEELTSMLTEIDRDGDGCISLEEFAAVSSAFEPASNEEELREAFGVFDADHDGKIAAEELMVVMAAIGDEKCTIEECRRMIAGVDTNGDGFVCFEDFSRMMNIQRC